MKKWLILGLAVVGLASMAATCRVINISLTEIDNEAVFAGELKNETTASFINYRVVVAFLNDDLEVIDTKTVEGCVRSLRANNSTFFAAVSDEDPADAEVGLARLALDSTLKVGTPVSSGLEISGVSAFRVGDTITVSGNILNDGSADVEDSRVCIVVWDDDGNVVTVALDSKVDVDEDDDYDFEIDVDVPDEDDVDVDHVDVYVDGLIDGDPTVAEVDDDKNVVEGTPTPTRTPTASPTHTPTNTPTP